LGDKELSMKLCLEEQKSHLAMLKQIEILCFPQSHPLQQLSPLRVPIRVEIPRNREFLSPLSYVFLLLLAENKKKFCPCDSQAACVSYPWDDSPQSNAHH